MLMKSLAVSDQGDNHLRLLPRSELKVFAPSDFALTVGGVEESGFFSWIHRQLIQHRMLYITINHKDTGGTEKPIVYGYVGGGGASLYLPPDEFSDQPDNEGIVDILKNAKPDILLITLEPLVGTIFENLLSNVANEGIITFLAAGNEPKHPPPFSGTEVEKKILIAAAVALNGLPASFSQQNNSVYWAPGPLWMPSLHMLSMGLQVCAGFIKRIIKLQVQVMGLQVSN
jgi:hypothetical protein